MDGSYIYIQHHLGRGSTCFAVACIPLNLCETERSSTGRQQLNHLLVMTMMMMVMIMMMDNVPTPFARVERKI